MELERRSFQECRVSAVDERRLSGYAIVTNALSQNLGGFREQIAPEALDRTFREAIDVRALVDHDSGKVLARLTAGTLELKKDSRGLKVWIEPDAEISYAGDIIRSVRRGDISGMSFGFRALEDDWNYDGDIPVRTVLDMRVSEVSIVSWPAYTQTDVAVAQRSLDDFRAAVGRDGLAWRKKQLRTALAR
jgi:HK97 family phage prohead protease